MGMPFDLLEEEDKGKLHGLIEDLARELRLCQVDIDVAYHLLKFHYDFMSHLNPRLSRTEEEIKDMTKLSDEYYSQMYPAFRDDREKIDIVKKNEENVRKYQYKLANRDPECYLHSPDVKTCNWDTKPKKKWWKFW
jgi:hypothetical protein